MKNKYRIPDFRNIYPGASQEVIEVLRQTERKMQYQERDLKAGNYKINQEDEKVTFIPSREDSLDRLLELERQFIKEQPSVEEEAIRAVMYEELHHAIQKLTEEEQELIELLYFDEKSERDIAQMKGICHNAIHKQKHRILHKLEKILKKFQN